jgi:hypothetical protein
VSMPPKVCPECGEEYVHAASVCVHCDVPLVLEGEAPDAAQIAELPPIAELICVRASSVGWAMGLSERLVEAGIPHRVQAASADDDEGGQRRPGANLPFGVFVRPEDEAAASEIDLAHTEHEIPGIPEDFDPSATDTDQCPACGDPILETATECPGCGLALLAAG